MWFGVVYMWFGANIAGRLNKNAFKFVLQVFWVFRMWVGLV